MEKFILINKSEINRHHNVVTFYLKEVVTFDLKEIEKFTVLKSIENFYRKLYNINCMFSPLWWF